MLLIVVPALLNLLLLPAAVIGEVGLAIVRRKPEELALRLAIMAGIITAASSAQVKEIDRIEVYPLPTTSMSIADYNGLANRNGYLIGGLDPSVAVRFSADRLSLRAFANELADQTGKQAHIGSCGNGGSILFGMSPMGGIMLED